VKKLLQIAKETYHLQISSAKANHYEAVMFPLNCEHELYCLIQADDEDIYDMAYESGWDRFVVIDFLAKTEKIINLHESDVA